MKNLGAKLKDKEFYKTFFISHGEKVGLGVVGLLVVFALFKTSWSGYEKTPGELRTLVKDVKTQVLTSDWPDGEKKKFEDQMQVTIQERVKQFMSPVDYEPYAYSVPMFYPLHPQKEPIVEPEYLPVIELDAMFARVLLNVDPEDSSHGEMIAEADTDAVEEEEFDDLEDEDESDIPARFRRRKPKTGNTGGGAAGGANLGAAGGGGQPGAGGGGPPGMSGAGAGGAPGAAGGFPGGGGGFPGGGGGAAGGAPGMGGGGAPGMGGGGAPGMGGGGAPGMGGGGAPGMGGGGAPGMGGMGNLGMEVSAGDAGQGGGDLAAQFLGQGGGGPAAGSGSQSIPSSVGRGFRFVAVRGVFPLNEQIRAIRKALHLPSALDPSEIQKLVVLLDFVLERQTAIPGDDPWSGDWERVDSEVAFDILDQVRDFDTDVVDTGIVDQAITMPLPMRLFGEWSDEASHPSIENYVLTSEELDQANEIAGKMLEQQRELLAKQNKKQTIIVKGGFASRQADMRSIRDNVMRKSKNELLDGLQMSKDDEDLRRELTRRIEQRTTASGRLILFRYFDFDVAPGRAYRYRVRLVLRNPNFKRPVEQLAHPDLAKGATRVTPMSDPTGVVFVPDDAEYFLADAETGRTGTPSAMLNVYQWYSETGTTINELLKVEEGEFIGGSANTYVLKPAIPSFEKEDADFVSNDLLLDLMPAPRVYKSDHPQLIPPDVKTKIGKTLGITDRAVVTNSRGELVSLDASIRSGGRRKRKLDQTLKWERGPFEDIKDRDSGKEEDTADSDSIGRELAAKRRDRLDNEAGKEDKRRPNPTRIRRGRRNR